jgi:hypothetical protein
MCNNLAPYSQTSAPFADLTGEKIQQGGDLKNELTDKELQKEIIRLLKENNGEMEEKILCDLLGITSYDIPWGYNIGWARCVQANQAYHLLLSGQYNEHI